MTRPLVVVALLAWPASVFAQSPSSNPSTPNRSGPGPIVIYGPPMLGGNLVSGPPISNGSSALFPIQTPVPPRFSVGGGAMSGYPQVWLPSGPWGGVNYRWPEYEIIEVMEPEPAPNKDRPATVFQRLASSGQTKATLVMEFPAAAEIWVDGKKCDGKQAAEWIVTSPLLQASAKHTFEVKAKWEIGGKTFESTRSISVSAGDRNRLIELAGVEVKNGRAVTAR